MNKLKLLIPLGIFLALILLFWQGLKLDPHLIPSPLVNKPLPEINLPGLMDDKIYLNNQVFKNKVSLLVVWASWCEVCQSEHPFMMDLAEEKIVPIYAIDYKDNKMNVLAWLSQNGNPYEIIGFDKDGQASVNLGVYGTPEIFVIDQQGFIRYKLIGQLTPQIWQTEILPLINRLKKANA